MTGEGFVDRQKKLVCATLADFAAKCFIKLAGTFKLEARKYMLLHQKIAYMSHQT